MEQSKLCGRDHEVRESALRQYHPVVSEDLREELQENSERSQPTEAHDEAEDSSEIHAKRFNAKEVLTPVNGENFMSPIADSTVKLSGGDQGIRKSIPIRDQPVRGEELTGDRQKQSDGSSPIDTQTDNGEVRTIFGRSKEITLVVVTFEPRVQLYVPNEESFPTPLRYIDVVRRTNTTLDVLQESRTDDYWSVDGDRNPSEPWTGFTLFTK